MAADTPLVLCLLACLDEDLQKIVSEAEQPLEQVGPVALFVQIARNTGKNKNTVEK